MRTGSNKFLCNISLRFQILFNIGHQTVHLRKNTHKYF